VCGRWGEVGTALQPTLILALVRDPPAAVRSGSCSETSNLLDEDLHLVLRDGAVAVLVELLEAGLEVLLGELSRLSHFRKSVLDELLGLALVEEAGVVLVVGLPDVVNALLDDAVDV